MTDGFDGSFSGAYYLSALFSHNDDNDFLELPEETQQFLLKKGADSEEALHRQLEELKMKE